MSRPGPGEGLAHELQGEDGEVVLLLNGGMMTHGSWAPVTTALLAEHRVLGCDFRGQLLSPGDAHPELGAHVQDVVDLLDALNLEAVHVLGTSFGGEVGLLLTAEHPERVRTLAAVTAADRTPPGMRQDVRELKELIKKAAAGDAAAFHERLVRDVYSAEHLEAHGDELLTRRGLPLPPAWYLGLIGILDAVADFDLTDALPRITCPTLVVHAARDTVMPLERVQALAEGIRGAELSIHPTSGHALVSEDPAWLADTYQVFLRRHT